MFENAALVVKTSITNVLSNNERPQWIYAGWWHIQSNIQYPYVERTCNQIIQIREDGKLKNKKLKDNYQKINTISSIQASI